MGRVQKNKAVVTVQPCARAMLQDGLTRKLGVCHLRNNLPCRFFICLAGFFPLLKSSIPKSSSQW